MIVYHYYVIYVEVPTGYPGVEDIFATDRYEAFGTWKIRNPLNKKAFIKMTEAK